MARKEKKYHFIYKTTNLLNGKYYIGMHSTDNLNDGYMGSGKRLRRSLNKYGIENHKVEAIEFFENRSDLIKKEKEIITLNEIAKEECMNLMPGGIGGFISEEQQRIRSIAGGKAFAKRLKNDEKFRLEISDKLSKRLKKQYKKGKREKIYFFNWNDKQHDEKTKIKISETKKGTGIGKENSQHGTCWITKNEINKKIKKEELKKFINQGWIKGRKINMG